MLWVVAAVLSSTATSVQKTLGELFGLSFGSPFGSVKKESNRSKLGRPVEVLSGGETGEEGG